MDNHETAQPEPIEQKLASRIDEYDALLIGLKDTLQAKPGERPEQLIHLDDGRYINIRFGQSGNYGTETWVDLSVFKLKNGSGIEENPGKLAQVVDEIDSLHGRHLFSDMGDQDERNETKNIIAANTDSVTTVRIKSTGFLTDEDRKRAELDWARAVARDGIDQTRRSRTKSLKTTTSTYGDGKDGPFYPSFTAAGINDPVFQQIDMDLTELAIPVACDGVTLEGGC